MVLYGLLIDIFVFSQPFSGFELVGASVILVVTVSTVIYKYKVEGRGKPEEASDYLK